MGSDPFALLNQAIRKISIHAPAWGATGVSCQYHFSQSISIHAPAWGATSSSASTSATARFQSTLPRGERPMRLREAPELPHISIHAPAWGATARTLFTTRISSDFNPRSRVGSDVLARCSIHLPNAFQSTLPRGERRNSYAFPLLVRVFQSTLPRGERQVKQVARSALYRFQSTLPRGERLRELVYNSQ